MKRAVVLFNLGGPDSLAAVQPFLFNLFNDPAIIGLPQPFRWLLAKLISSRRAPIARDIYAEMGGKSPLVELTDEQASGLEALLRDRMPGDDWKVVVAMRYWKPFAEDAARALKAFGPDEITLLPLYPQFSTTTTGSSLKDWERAAKAAGVSAPTRTVCCYPEDAPFVAAQAALVAKALEGVPDPVRVLFSAHGLPKRVIEAGDPYQDQVERTVAAVVAKLGRPDLDYVTCYQSKVGPLEWIGPATDAEIERAGAEKRNLVVVPIAFVSEHSETLVELDIEYGKLARETGVGTYVRVPALGTDPGYLETLANAVSGAGAGCAPAAGQARCGAGFSGCPCRA